MPYTILDACQQQRLQRSLCKSPSGLAISSQQCFRERHVCMQAAWTLKSMDWRTPVREEPRSLQRSVRENPPSHCGRQLPCKQQQTTCSVRAQLLTSSVFRMHPHQSLYLFFSRQAVSNTISVAEKDRRGGMCRIRMAGTHTLSRPAGLHLQWRLAGGLAQGSMDLPRPTRRMQWTGSLPARPDLLKGQ